MLTDEQAALVERLASHMGKQDVPVLLADCRQAAATITALQARVSELERVARDMRDLAIRHGATNYVDGEHRVNAARATLGERHD